MEQKPNLNVDGRLCCFRGWGSLRNIDSDIRKVSTTATALLLVPTLVFHTHRARCRGALFLTLTLCLG